MTTHKRIASIASAVLVVATTAIGLAQPKGATVTMKGEAVDLWCYMEGGDRGPAKKDCATACAKAGNAIGIVDATGGVYVVSGLQDHQPARDVLIGRMNEQVEVTGTLVSKGGAKMIFVKSVKPSASTPETIVFVCPFGSAKSVVAARFFNRMATERGLPYRAVARGLTPEATIPSYVREPIRADGFEIGAAEKPVRLETAEVKSASAVVCIMCELPKAQSAAARESIRWTDVPDVDAGYGPARDKIVAHLNELVGKLRPF
jgi:arsenate reductase